MFNSVFYGGDTAVQVNAVTGGIVKNHKDSFFLKFHLGSQRAKTLLSPQPFRWIDERYERNKQRVEVLQLVIVGDMEVVAEIIDLPEEKTNAKQ
jgi:hypothetical protein